MNYTEFRANERNREALDHVRGCILKAASYTDPDTGLVIEPRPVDKSTRIRQMLELGRTDLGKWMHTGEMDKNAEFDPNVLGNYIKANYGAVGGGALGLLAGAMLGARLGGKHKRLLGMLLGGSIGAMGMGYSGDALQQSGALESAYNTLREAAPKGYDMFRNAWDKGTHAAAVGLKNVGNAISAFPDKIGLK
jgi:hypothetical protein